MDTGLIILKALADHRDAASDIKEGWHSPYALCLSVVRGPPKVQQEEQEYLHEGALYISEF